MENENNRNSYDLLEAVNSFNKRRSGDTQITDSLLEDRFSKTTMEMANEMWEEKKAREP